MVAPREVISSTIGVIQSVSGLVMRVASFVVIVWLMISSPTYATDTRDDVQSGGRWMNISWENDFIDDDDSGYTNGFGISWGKGFFNEFSDDNLPAWLNAIAQRLPYSNDAAFQHSVSYQLSQQMYTPDDINAEEVIEDDRPYAGVLLWSGHLHSFNSRFSNRYWMSLGAVGPISGAEYVQDAIHGIIGVNNPKGWDNQLDNEAVFLLANERLYRLKVGLLGRSGIEYDITGMSELMAGTLRSEVGAGFGFRIGQRLERSFPAASLIPGRNVNPLMASVESDWQVFVNFYGRYVFNDITLDGNYFSDSHSVTLTNEQAFVSLGAAWHGSNWGIVASVQDSTELYEERKENTLFGTFSVTWRL